MMRSLSAFFGGGLGRADVHAPVGLAAVGVDDLAPEALAQFHGQTSFAHGGGADYGDQGCRDL